MSVRDSKNDGALALKEQLKKRQLDVSLSLSLSLSHSHKQTNMNKQLICNNIFFLNKMQYKWTCIDCEIILLLLL